MRAVLPLVSLVSLSSAAAIRSRDSAQAFRLVAVSAGLSNGDLSSAVHGSVVSSLHVGAGLNAVGLSKSSSSSNSSSGSIFFANGTQEEVSSDLVTVTSDQSGFPEGLQIASYRNGQGGNSSSLVKPVSMDAGPGTAGVRVAGPADSGSAYELVAPGSGVFAACNDTLPYYKSAYFLLLKWIDQGNGSDADVPDNCIAIRLLPKCAELNTLAAGSSSTHDFVQPTFCYSDPVSVEDGNQGS